ncbi:MAG: hypothetical protein R3E91_01240 [Chlamydiales bacterium]
MSSINSNLVNNIKGQFSKTFDQILALPDKPSKAWQRKALYILFDLGMILLACGLMVTTMGSGIGHTLQNLSLTNIMMIVPLTGLAGLGLTFLIQDIIPQKAHRNVAKVMAVAAPLLLVAGIAALFLAAGKASGGGIFSLTQAMTNSYFYIGLLLMPIAFHLATRVPRVFRKTCPYIMKKHSPSKIKKQARQSSLVFKENDPSAREVSRSHRHNQ